MDFENFYHWGPPGRLWTSLEGETTTPKQEDWWNIGARYPDRDKEIILTFLLP